MDYPKISTQNAPTGTSSIAQQSEDVNFSANRLDAQVNELRYLLYGDNQGVALSPKSDSTPSVHSNLAKATDTLTEVERMLCSLIDRIRGN